MLALTAQLNAQVEFIDQIGIGLNYGFIQEKGNNDLGFHSDYLLGVYVHNWNTAILMGIRGDILHESVDAGIQVEHFINFKDSGNLTGFGFLAAGGIQFLGDDGINPYIRIGGLWHWATIIKIALELDYHFNGQFSSGISVSLPLATVSSRLEILNK